MAATKPTVTTEYRNDQHVKVTTPSYKLSADGQSIEFIGPQTPTMEKIEGGDLRDPDDTDHAGGATGWREDEFIADYQAMDGRPDSICRRVGFLDALECFWLKTGFPENSAGIHGAIRSRDRR